MKSFIPQTTTEKTTTFLGISFTTFQANHSIWFILVSYRTDSYQTTCRPAITSTQASSMWLSLPSTRPSPPQPRVTSSMSHDTLHVASHTMDGCCCGVAQHERPQPMAIYTWPNAYELIRVRISCETGKTALTLMIDTTKNKILVYQNDAN